MRQNLRPVQLAAERSRLMPPSWEPLSELLEGFGVPCWVVPSRMQQLDTLGFFSLAFHLPGHREAATHQTTSSARRRVRFLRVIEPNHPRAMEGGRPQPGHHAIFRVHPVASHRPSQSSA